MKEYSCPDVPESGTQHPAEEYSCPDVPESGTQHLAKENVCPKLPIMKNMDEREETYYRFGLPDGSAIVIMEYPYTLDWDKAERFLLYRM